MTLYSFTFHVGPWRFTVKASSAELAQECANLICPRTTPVLMGIAETL